MEYFLYGHNTYKTIRSAKKFRLQLDRRLENLTLLQLNRRARILKLFLEFCGIVF